MNSQRIEIPKKDMDHVGSTQELWNIVFSLLPDSEHSNKEAVIKKSKEILNHLEK